MCVFSRFFHNFVTKSRIYSVSEEKTNAFVLFFSRLFVTLAPPKLLALGNAKEKSVFFCISLVFS